MNNRKNYNSIVFLTTLSVYLGLVLVGGAMPSVLAQAATTRGFDIKSEIVIEDDLDKKPDNEEIDNFLKNGLDKAIAEFIEDLRQLKQKGKYKSNFKKIFSTACNFSFCSDGKAAASSSSIMVKNQEKEQDLKISDALLELRGKINIGNRLDSSKISFIEFSDEQKGCKEFSLNLNFSQKELKIEVGFSKESTQKAIGFAENLNRKFNNKSFASSDLLIKKVYENTKAASENNQVFIVTRLPRGSIDALLAQKDAQ